MSCSCVKEYKSCGTIVEMYRNPTSQGFYPHIVYMDDSTKRNIDISVSTDTYINTKVGNRVCFTFSH